MKKTTLRQVAFKLAIVALVLLSPLGLRAQVQEQVTMAFYPPDEEYATGYTDGTTKTSGEMHTVSNGGVQGWMKFDVSAIPDDATINSITLKFYCNSTSNCYVKLTSAGQLDPVTASASELYSAITTTTPNYYTSSYMNGFSSVGWKTFNMSSDAVSNLQNNGIADDYFTVGFNEYESGSYYLYAYGYDNNTYRPYIEVTFTATVSCPKPTITLGNFDATTATVSWTPNGSESEWNVYLDGVQVNTNPITEPTYTFQNLTPITEYTLGVTAVCDGSEESFMATTTVLTPCAAIDDLTTPYTMGFETDDLQGTTNALSIPWCWNRLNNATSSSYNYYPYAYNFSSEAHGGSRYLRFYYYGYSWSSQADYQIVMLPEIDVDALPLSTLRLRFYARSNGSYSGDISVGTMADPDDPETFSEVESFNITGTTYDLKTVASFPDDGSRYIAIRMVKPDAAAYRYAYIDDLTLELLPNCLEPSGLQPVANSETTESVELTWTPGGSESEWDIYYTDDPADVPDENTTPMVEGITENDPYLLEGLNPSTHYYVYVRANCGGDQSPWSQRGEFNTACDAVTTFPWSENFEGFAAATSTSYVEANKVNDPCWLNEHYLDGTGSSGTMTLFQVTSYTQTGNSTNKLQLPDMKSGTQTLLRLPEMSLPNANYQFTIDVLRNVSGTSYTSEGVRVYASADGEIDNATELGFLYRNCNQTDGNIVPDEGSTGWYTYEFPIPFSGTCYIILRGESQYGSATYMDNLVVEQVPTCRKPSAPMLETPSSRTAHTATLKWTNGEAGQTEWEIAYMAGNNFNPNDDAELANATLVPANANPYTIEDLAQSTTYYAYVRANCGGDYSAWSVAYVSFQTLAGNVTPTGLAVAANTITSDQATASWNAVAGNTQHESYDIYWDESTVTSVPDEPAAPNLISGISATSQLIEGLEPEHTYKVWVRDNCGTDGLSAWSSAVTFTTASACNTPDNLVASNVTNNSAQLSWAAYGIDDFNLQYRVSGEEWDDNNIIYNVNTPYTFDPILTGNITYQVRVQATCAEDPTADDSWSNVASFTTACDPESMPWSENFDTWTSKSVCWSFMQGQYNMGQGTPTTYSSAWGLSSSYGSYITIDGKALTMNLYSNNRYWAVTPAINITTDDAVLKVDVAMSAWSAAAPNYDDNDTLAFAISTDGGNTFTNLRVLDGDDLNNLGNDYTTIYVPVAGYNGQAVRFAIYGGSINNVSSSNDNRCVIDNVSVEEAPSCFPVGTLTYDNTSVTPFAADLSWGLVDNTQDAWEIEYATDENFTENVQTRDADNNDFTLDGLTPETHYYVRVHANCEASGNGFGEWSNVIDFTTGIACPKPTDLDYDLTSLTQTSVELSWTENGSASAWKVAYKAEDAADFSETMVLENPYTLGGLTQGTNYTVKVRAMCGGDYGNSQWSDEINFQTVAACPAPENLAVTTGSETGHGATITWEGTNDSYTIEVGEAISSTTTSLLEENFDGNDMPTGWSIMDLGTSNWSVSNTNNAGGDANELHLYYSPSFNGTSRLVTPAIDLTGISEVTFTFKHYYDHYSGSNALGIATSSDGGTTWNDGWNESYSADASGTISEVISTSDMGNANVLFCIYYTGNSYNIDNWYFDDITITYEQPNFGNWTELATNVTDNSYVINTLNPETQYAVRVKGVCGGTPSPASNIVGFTTPEACPAPTNVTVNNSTITDNSAEISWDGSASNYNVHYRTAAAPNALFFDDFESGLSQWTIIRNGEGTENTDWRQYDGSFTNTPVTPHSGTYMAMSRSWSSDAYNVDNWLITPQVTLDGTLRFWVIDDGEYHEHYDVYVSTTGNTIADFGTTPFYEPGDASGTWTEITVDLSSFAGAQGYIALRLTDYDQDFLMLDDFGIYGTPIPAGDWTTTTANSNSTEIEGLTESTLYDVEVQAVCGSDLSAWVATTFTTLQACAAPTAFTQDAVAADAVTFSWTAGNGNTAWDVYVKAQGGDYPSTPNATVTTPEATIDNLVANTSYSVKIVPDCDGTKSLEVANAFKTLCGVIAIDADNPYNEGFEGTVDCWSVGDPETTSGNGYNWTLNTSYVHSNNYSITNGGYYGPVYLYTPTFNITGANAALSFWSYNLYPDYYGNDNGKNSVLVTTDGGANWTEIWSPSSVSEEWVPTTIDLTDYIGQNIKFCFLFEGNDAHQWFIDDVELYVPASYTKDVVANKWYAISTPVHNNGNNETVAGVTNLTNEANDLYLYNENEGKWVKEATSLAPGKGYIYRRVADATLTFIGIDNTGSIEPTITNSCADNTLAGFNLVGNPYPYAVNPDMSCYKLTPAGTWKVKTTSENVEVCEAVLVYTDDASTTVTFTTASKSSATSTAIAFTVSNGEFEDVAYANLGNGDNLPKIGHLTAEAPMLSIPMEGRRYAIANLGEECESFNMVFRGTGEYTLSVNSANSGVSYLHLIDQVTGKDIDLLREHTYTFTATGSDADRFTVKLRPEAAESTNGHFAYWNGNNWVVEGEGTLQVFDVLGRKIASHEVSSELSILNSQFPSTGVYVLRMGEKSQKIVVR